MTKDNIPLYSGYDNEEKSSNLYKIITNVVKVILFAVAIFLIGFVAAWGTFAATYYLTAQNEKPSNLMDESCFLQLPYYLLKNLQRELSVDLIVEDDMFPKNYDTLIEIRNAYDQKAQQFYDTWTKQFNIRSGFYKPEPTFIIAVVYFFSTLFFLVLRCIPLHHPGFIISEREAKILQIKQFLRALVYTYVFMMYAIGIFKLVNVFRADCSSQF